MQGNRSVCPNLTLEMSNLLTQRAKGISSHDEQGPNHADSAYKDRSSRHGERPRCIVDIDVVVDQPAGKITDTQEIEHANLQVGHVTGNHRGGKQADILKAVRLGALGADDATFGGGVDALVSCHHLSQRSRLCVVEMAGRGLLIELYGVDMGAEGESPCNGDGVKGDVAGVEARCHVWVVYGE
jgi:hypothetical protein